MNVSKRTFVIGLLIIFILGSVALSGSITQVQAEDKPPYSFKNLNQGHINWSKPDWRVWINSNVEKNKYVVWGHLPASPEEKERAYRLAKKFYDVRLKILDVEGLFKKYNITFAGYGIGYYIVGVKKLDPEIVVGIARELQEASERAHLGGMLGKDAPIIFVEAPEITLDNRESPYRPVIGGVKIATYQYSEGYVYEIAGTVGFAAVRNGVKGVVTNQHVLVSVGYPTYQPESPYYIGNVMAVGGEYSDSAFVPYSNVDNVIYSNHIIASYENPSVGAPVRMSGLSSDITYGHVTNYADVEHSLYGMLYNQVIATYSATHGDSGAPIYEPVYHEYVTIYGIHWGRVTYIETYSIFSPIGGIINDLGIQPLTG